MKRIAHDGDEQDCFHARRYYRWRPGEAKAIKRRASRRERRQGRSQIREQQEG
jgi:hypothetical protein